MEYNPVPKGTVNTGGAVVFGPSTAGQSLEKIGANIGRAATAIRANRQRQEIAAGQLRQKQLGDFAKSVDNGEVYFPFQRQVENEKRALYNDYASALTSSGGSGLSPEAAMSFEERKGKLFNLEKKSMQIQTAFKEARSLLGSGTYKDTIDLEAALSRLNDKIRDPNNADGIKNLADINTTDFTSDILGDHTIYKDNKVFEPYIKKLGDVKTALQTGGVPGGYSNRREFESNVPVVVDDATGQPVMVDGNMNIVKSGGKYLLDYNKMYQSIQGDPIALGKVHDAAAQIEADTQKALKNGTLTPYEFLRNGETDITTDILNERVRQKALGQATEKLFSPYISQEYVNASKLNRTPGGSGGSGSGKSAAPAFIRTDAARNYEYTDPKTGQKQVVPVKSWMSWSVNQNNNGVRGLTRDMVIPSDMLYLPESGKQVAETDGFQGRVAGYHIAFKTTQPITINGKKYGANQLVFQPTNTNPADFAAANSDKVTPVLLQSLVEDMPGSNKGTFVVTTGKVKEIKDGKPTGKMVDDVFVDKDPVTGLTTTYQGGQTISADYGTPEYQRLEALAERSKGAVVLKKQDSTPKSTKRVERIVATLDPTKPEGQNLYGTQTFIDPTLQSEVSKAFANETYNRKVGSFGQKHFGNKIAAKTQKPKFKLPLPKLK